MRLILDKDLLAEIIFCIDFPENYENVLQSGIFPNAFPLQKRWLGRSFLLIRKGIICEVNGKVHSIDDRPESFFGFTWSKNGQVHREGDRPAEIFLGGRQEWFVDGVLHREADRPSYISGKGCREWRKNGFLHRDGNKPARVFTDDENIEWREWWLNGELHREGDNPAKICEDGPKFFYTHGDLIRMELS